MGLILKMRNDKISAIKNTITRYNNVQSAKRFREGKLGARHRTNRLNKEFELVNGFIKKLPNKNIMALDIGCSGGRYTQTLIKNGFKAYGIDTSFIALKYATSKDNEAIFTKASVTHLPFKNEKFDFILCIELQHHFDDYFLEIILKEISRVIKPGGLFISDIRNSLNPIMWYSYRKRDGRHFTLKTRTLFKMTKVLKKYDFTIVHKKGLFFPITVFAPYVMLFAKNHRLEDP